jgi:hypothetical protein
MVKIKRLKIQHVGDELHQQVLVLTECIDAISLESGKQFSLIYWIENMHMM